MSSPGNQPTLTLKLERDSSPFTPRSPKNFPLQVDISSEDEYEKFLADLCNAEEELGLALPPGLATSQGSGQVKARKTRSKGRKIEGHRASWSVYQSLQCIIRERKNINTTSCLNDCRLPQKTHPFDCPIHKAPHPTDALSAVKFLMANHTGAAHAGGPVLPNFFIISPCQAPIPLASAVPAATARQVFRVADLDLCGGKVTSSGYFSHLVRATNSAAVATQEVFVPRADPQLSERPERGLRTGGGACSKKRRQTLLAAPCHASKAGRAWTKRYQRGATKNSAKSEEAGRRRRRAANDHNAGAAATGAQKAGAAATADEAGGRSAEEVVRTRRAQLRRGGVADERAATSRGGEEGAKSEEAGRRRRRAANDEAGGRSAEEVVRTRRAQLRRGGVADERAATSRWAQWRRGGARGAEVARKAGGRSGETSEAASPTTKIGRQRVRGRSGDEVEDDERSGNEVRRDERGGDEVVRGGDEVVRGRRAGAAARPERRRRRQRRSGGNEMNLNFLRAHSTCNRLKFLRTQAQLISRVPPRKVSISSHPCT
ncbi:hypothetical protein C8R47DRAFT_1074346 [Mycena vitilis]|nr:hypothetical protein C8R47DRAFT_1074346 [Mycena vitilis]